MTECRFCPAAACSNSATGPITECNSHNPRKPVDPDLSEGKKRKLALCQAVAKKFPGQSIRDKSVTGLFSMLLPSVFGDESLQASVEAAAPVPEHVASIAALVGDLMGTEHDSDDIHELATNLA